MLAGLGGVTITHVLGCASRPSGVVGLALPVTPDRPSPSVSSAPAAPAPERKTAAPPPTPVRAPELALPARPDGAETGSAFIRRIEGLGRAAIDDEVWAAVRAGNVPPFERHFLPIEIDDEALGLAVLHVTCDYLAIGSDEDFMRMPMTSAVAQRIADLVDASLPTRKLVDVIYRAATAKLPPSWIDGGPTEGTLADFIHHQKTLEARRLAKGFALGVLTAGDKKDIVLSPRMVEKPGRVAIYGWHRSDGDPIQPLSCVHSCRYADYSHGVRLVSEAMTINGEPHRVSEVLADPVLADLLSDEGPLPEIAYPTVLPDYEGTPKKR
jgi:hypothetical protein